MTEKAIEAELQELRENARSHCRDLAYSARLQGEQVAEVLRLTIENRELRAEMAWLKGELLRRAVNATSSHAASQLIDSESARLHAEVEVERCHALYPGLANK